MATKTKLKDSFEVETEYGAFYTGGNIQWTTDGKTLYCQDTGRINIIPVEGSGIQLSIGDAKESENIDPDIIYTFALSHNNETVVTSHKSGLLKMWSTNNGEMRKMWRAMHQGPIPKLCFNGDDMLIASGGSDASVRIWDYEQKMCRAAFRGFQGVVSVLAFNSNTNNPMIVVAADDNRIHCWNYKTKQIKHCLSGHFSKVTSIAFSVDTDEKYLVSSGRDKVLILWDLDAGTQVRSVPVYEGIEAVVIIGSDTKLPGNVALNKSKIYAAAAGENGRIKIWNMSGGDCMYEQTNSVIGKASEEGGQAITNVLINRTTSQVALVSVDHNIIIHNLSTFFCAKQLIGFADEILDMTFVGKKCRFLAVATNSPCIKVYDTNDMNCQILSGHTDIVLALASSENYLLSSSKDTTIRLWEIDPSSFTFKYLGSGTKHTSSVGSIAFGNMSHTMCASASQDTCLKMWTIPETIDAKQPITLNCVATQIAHDKDINCVTIAPNDRMVATGSQDKTAKIWDAKSLKMVSVFRGHRRGIWSVRFSPVDQVLLTTSADCNMRLWSLIDSTCLKSFEGHESSILKAEFLSKSMQIISAGSDGLIKLWSIKTSECIATFDKHENRIWALAIASDESYFYSGGTDSTLIKWHDTTELKKQRVLEEHKAETLQEQELANLMREKKMLKALRLALRLEKPLTSLKIINGLLNSNRNGLIETVIGLNEWQKQTLLAHATTWNTNSRNCQPAQCIINILLKEIIYGRFKPTGLGKIIEETLPYTDRHFKRMTEHLKELKFIEFTLRCMQPHVNLNAEMK